ncbi:MAG TPA: DUF721 domain-containing protein [Candidatus Sulfotelmatobacter sp.]|nr:DUF721 domain-containing protein [Candidatus Sulfotelmatobacter sp.]
MDRLDNLLQPTLRRMGVERSVRLARLDHALGEILGEPLAPLCSVIKLKGGTAHIATSHPVLAHQLHLETSRLMEALNERLGEPVVERLRFCAMPSSPAEKHR